MDYTPAFYLTLFFLIVATLHALYSANALQAQLRRDVDAATHQSSELRNDLRTLSNQCNDDHAQNTNTIAFLLAMLEAASPTPDDGYPPTSLNRIREQLARLFNADEMQTMEFDVFGKNAIMPTTTDGYAREITLLANRTGSTQKLIAYLRAARPNARW